MSRILFPPNNEGEAKAYIKALTGAQSVEIPSSPDISDLGEYLDVRSVYISFEASLELGFGFAKSSSDIDVKVLLQDYWFSKEVSETKIKEVNSWTFAVGFRVGIKIVGYNAKLEVNIGALAAKAQTEGLNIQIQLIRVGMPKGPDVPIDLAAPVTFDIDKFGDLKVWEGELLRYVAEKRSELHPVLVGASINISGERLLNDAPSARYAIWRIFSGMNLKSAIALLSSGKAPEIDQGAVRAVYAEVFNDQSMLVPDRPSENRIPTNLEKGIATNWINKYKTIK